MARYCQGCSTRSVQHQERTSWSRGGSSSVRSAEAAAVLICALLLVAGGACKEDHTRDVRGSSHVFTQPVAAPLEADTRGAPGEARGPESPPERRRIELGGVFPEAGIGWDEGAPVHDLRLAVRGTTTWVSAAGPRHLLSLLIDVHGAIVADTAELAPTVAESWTCGVAAEDVQGYGYIWGLRRTLSSPTAPFAARLDARAGELEAAQPLSLPEGWRVRDAGPRPCVAWPRGSGEVSFALVLAEPPGIGIVRYAREGGLPTGTSLWAAEVAVEPAWTVATLDAQAWVGVRLAASSGGAYQMLAVWDMADGALGIEAKVAEPGDAVSGLVALLNGPGMLVARASTSVDVRAHTTVLWRAHDGAERPLGEVLQRSWEPPLRALSTGGGLRVLTSPRAASALEHRVTLLLDPMSPHTALAALPARRASDAAVWGPDGSWIVVGTLADEPGEDPERPTPRTFLELEWFAAQAVAP